MKHKRLLAVCISALLCLAIAAIFVACDKTEPEQPLTLRLHSAFGEDEVQTVTCLRTEVSAQAPFTREGYTFKGWTTRKDSGVLISDKTVLQNDVDLYAVWELNVYTVRFTVNGTDVCESQKITHGEGAVAPEYLDFWDKIPAGTRFAGWKTQFDVVTADLNVEADLPAADFTATFVDPFDSNKLYYRYGGKNGDCVPEPLSSPAARAGFKFNGWRTESGVFYSTDAVHADHDSTYYAMFVIDGEALASPTVQGPESVQYGDRVILNATAPTSTSQIDYSSSKWIEGGDAIKQNALTLDLDSKTLAIGEHTVTLEITAKHAAIAKYDMESSAVISATHTFTVTKRTASIEFSEPTSPSQNWTGEDILFDFGEARLSQATADLFEGEPQFTYSVDGRPVQLNDIKVRDGGTYSVTATLAESAYFTSASKTVTVEVQAVRVFARTKGDYAREIDSALGMRDIYAGRLFTLERALSIDPLARDIALKDTEVLVIMPIANVNLAGEYTLNSRARLALPYQVGDDTKMFAHSEDARDMFYIDISNESEFLKLCLTLKQGATLNVEGNVRVGGVGSSPMTNSFQGATQGDYAQITVDEGATLIVKKGGMIENNGYIKGDGAMTMESGGILYTPYVVRDFRGGTNTTGVFRPQNSQTEPICPFNQYDFPNVQVLQTLYSGAEVYAYCSLYASGAHNTTTTAEAPPVISRANAMINIESGYITVKVTEDYNGSVAANIGGDWSLVADAYPTTTTVQLFGNVNIGALSIKVQTVTVNTSVSLFSVPNGVDITVKSGATLTMPNKAKILPGAKITVDSGAELILAAGSGSEGGKVVVYDDGWTDRANTGRHLYPKHKGAAQFIVNGTLTIKGGKMPASFGGLITSTQAGAKVVIESGALLEVTALEGSTTHAAAPFGTGMPDSDITYNHTYRASLNGFNGTVESGKTYTFNGTTWTAN